MRKLLDLRKVRFFLVMAMCFFGQLSLAQVDEVRCDYARKFQCAPSGCEEGEVGSAYLLVPKVDALLSATIQADGPADLPSIRRCDSSGCSPVTVRATRSGAFVNVSAGGGGYFLKFLAIDFDEGVRRGDFVEVASTFLGAINYFGSCPDAIN